MKTRTQRIQPEQQVIAPARPLVSVPDLLEAAADDKPVTRRAKPGRGGVRPGAGRKPFREDKRKGAPAYVSMTNKEKELQIKRAQKRGLTLSFYIREKLGLPV